MGVLFLGLAPIPVIALGQFHLLSLETCKLASNGGQSGSDWLGAWVLLIGTSCLKTRGMIG